MTQTGLASTIILLLFIISNVFAKRHLYLRIKTSEGPRIIDKKTIPTSKILRVSEERAEWTLAGRLRLVGYAFDPGRDALKTIFIEGPLGQGYWLFRLPIVRPACIPALFLGDIKYYKYCFFYSLLTTVSPSALQSVPRDRTSTGIKVIRVCPICYAEINTARILI